MKNHSHSGFTLVEVLISLLLLGIVLAGGVAFYVNSSEEMALAIHKKIATELASSQMEDIKRGGYAALPDPAATPGVVWTNEDVMIATLPALTADGLGRKVKVLDVDDTGDGTTDYKEVTVEIKWKESGKESERTVTLVTFLAP